MPMAIVPCICIMFNLQSAWISLIPRMWEYDRDVKKIALDSKTPALPFTVVPLLIIYLIPLKLGSLSAKWDLLLIADVIP